MFLCVTAVTLLSVSAPSHDTYEFFHRHPNCDCPQVSDEGTEAGMESLSHMSNVEALSRAGTGDGGTVPGPSSGKAVLRGSSMVRGSPPTHIPGGEEGTFRETTLSQALRPMLTVHLSPAPSRAPPLWLPHSLSPLTACSILASLSIG